MRKLATLMVAAAILLGFTGVAFAAPPDTGDVVILECIAKGTEFNVKAVSTAPSALTVDEEVEKGGDCAIALKTLLEDGFDLESTVGKVIYTLVFP